MNPKESYRSPLETRYGSAAMRKIWSPQRKFSTWRRLWLALAEAQRELGLNITPQQIDELRTHLDDIDYESAAKYEADLHHDVMAHIHALGDVAPAARPIIHLGATSQFVNCNTELILIRDSLQLIGIRMARVVDALGAFATKFRELPTLGLTHLQPAQPTTVGKRAAIWAYDFAIALEEIEYRLETLRFRGAKGATGTQASFLRLFDGDPEKVEQLDKLITQKMGWPSERRYVVTGQTYPRLVDAQVLNTLAVTAAAVHKYCNDIRLLASRAEIQEPFEDEQIGSSAMPHKRNPMLCERATGLARFVMAMAPNALNTAATQWLERTLDDSANRRLSLPESFLTLDAALDVVHQVTRGLVVCEETIRANLMAELPFLAGENILIGAVTQGADRQEAHKILRRHSRAAAEHIRTQRGPNDLLDRLRGEPMFAKVDLDAALELSAMTGLAPRQVDRLIEQVVEPIRLRYAEKLREKAEVGV
ncbi:MAG: adenylosuccinate lyase [Planctomycetota bacterium]|nr:adenylosuccinate lyase [Planctomycetota bacterium]MCZ6811394.1 adenylosuccinate lyase [Planctomycetota bacterium]MCZ6851526.1 adenylosuccinate lyase [Planctomycetota bacterium]